MRDSSMRSMRGSWPALAKLTVYTTVVTVLTALLLMIIVNARSGPAHHYRARFADATGLAANDNVKIAGVSIGRVTAVEVADRRVAEVRFKVDREVSLPADVRAVIRYENLIGDRYLELQRPSRRAAPALAPGSMIPLSRTTPAVSLTVLFGGFRPLFQALQPDQVNALAEDILRTLQGEGGTIESLLQHTASLTGTIADQDQVVGSLISQLNDVLGTVSRRDQHLSELIVQLQRFVSGLSADRRVLGSSLSSLDELAGSVAGLLRDVRPPLRKDIRALGAVADNLQASEPTVSRWLQELPLLLNRIDRTASYGSWFQFYLCRTTGSYTLPGQAPTEIELSRNTDAERCS